MAIYLKIAFLNMKRRKSRFILTTITLIIGVALFGGILITNDSFSEIFVKDLDNRIGTADLLMRNDDSGDGWFNKTELDGIMDEIVDIDSIAYRIAGFGVFLSDTDKGNQIENSTYTAIYGIDIKDKEEKKLGKNPYIIDSVVEGTSIEELLDYSDVETGEKVLVISEALKYYIGKISAGDNVWVLPEDGEKTIDADLEDTGTWIKYTITAIVRDYGEAVDFDPEDPDNDIRPSQGPCIFVDIKNAHELAGGIDGSNGEYNLAVLGINNIRNIVGVKNNLEKKFDTDTWKMCDLKTETIDEIESSVGVLVMMLMMFALIALILSIVLIMNIFDVIKKEQEYETGMYQAIGVSKLESFKLFLCQGLIMGVIGSIIGTVCSIFISNFIFILSMDMMNYGGPENAMKNVGIVVYPNTLIITFIIGLIACIMASVYPSWKASRKPIIECLNPHSENINKKKRSIKRRKVYWGLSLSMLISGIFIMIAGSVGSVKGQGTIDPPTAGESMVMMISIVFILLGFIGLMALIIGPLIRGISMLFMPYLKHTKGLTQKNILRNRKRTKLTFSMVALTLSFLIGMSILFDSMNAGFVYTVDDIMGSDIQLFTGNTPDDFKDDLENYEKIDNVMGVKSIPIYIKSQKEWIGEDDRITANIMDMNTWKQSINSIDIYKSNGLSTQDLLEEIDTVYSTFITKELADDLDIHLNDLIEVNFSLGVQFANISAALERNYFNAENVYVLQNFTVVAIIHNAPGFSNSGFVSEGKLYDIFISWKIYEQIAQKELPGDGIDIMLKQQPETGNTQFDKIFPEWFNISEVMPILDDVSGITDYTTRMEYAIGTQVGDIVDMNVVVGIRDETDDKLLSDSQFGSHTILEKDESYVGNNMEELLSTDENVCLVYQDYVDEQKEKGNEDFGIGAQITIYSDQLQPYTFTIIGILDNPVLYNTERFNWYAGYEVGFDVVETEKSIFINYEKARELIYTKRQGSDSFNDEVTSLLIKVDNPYKTDDIIEQLETKLETSVGGNWSIIDLNTRTLDSRMFISQWFVWLEKGENDEEVVEELSNYIESEEIILYFALTRTYIFESFASVMDLIDTMISGMLIFAIIISMIGLTLHCLVSTMARRREIGMLRSIGLTKSGVIRTISGETILVAVLGAIVGVIGGLVIGILLTMYGPGTSFVAFKLLIPWTKISIIIMITILTALLGSIFTSRWAANINIIEAIRTR